MTDKSGPFRPQSTENVKMTERGHTCSTDNRCDNCGMTKDEFKTLNSPQCTGVKPIGE